MLWKSWFVASRSPPKSYGGLMRPHKASLTPRRPLGTTLLPHHSKKMWRRRKQFPEQNGDEGGATEDRRELFGTLWVLPSFPPPRPTQVHPCQCVWAAKLLCSCGSTLWIAANRVLCILWQQKISTVLNPPMIWQPNPSYDGAVSKRKGPFSVVARLADLSDYQTVT